MIYMCGSCYCTIGRVPRKQEPLEDSTDGLSLVTVEIVGGEKLSPLYVSGVGSK